MRVGGAALAVIIVLLGAACSDVATSEQTSRWVPTPGLRWQYQLQGAVDPDVCEPPATVDPSAPCVRPDVVDIDLYEQDGKTLNTRAVSAIHARDAHAVCYVDAGTWENWRPDAPAYPSQLLGKSNGWPGERWVDIRNRDAVLRILTERVKKCATAGFDAVDFDNVDALRNDTGFPITPADQLAFNRAVADAAHAHGLSVGLKNDLKQLDDLEPFFDFAVNEQCAEYNECGFYDRWLMAGKAVVEVEYGGDPHKFCPDAAIHNRDAMAKEKSLLATPWGPCR